MGYARLVGRHGIRWLLLSDLHFKYYNLDRVRKTAEWIDAEAERNQVGRVVVRRLSCLHDNYRFIGLLSGVVPRVHIVLGNHDLAYRRDYQTTALDALNIKRLAPCVSLHSVITPDVWDGRPVLLLPFREEQDELVEAAGKTVEFGHLAINKAITQRYVVKAGVDNPRTTNTVTSVCSLARTFTGHFHSHQTITQEQSGSTKVDLRGSITYLGSPFQLNWADLYDEQRGFVLFDPETLEHELLINPHAVGYTIADLQQVLGGQVEEGAVTDKHVVLLGKLTHLTHVTARDKLLSLGVRSVRNWTPVAFALRAADAAVQRLEEEPIKDETGRATTTDGVLGFGPGAESQAERRNLAAEAREYVESLDLNETLLLRREELVRVGQRIIQASRETAGQDGEVKARPSIHIFHTLTIDFRQDLPRELTFLVGENGSGKTMLIEAMTWCQFGRCIRDGLAVNDVVNDNVGNNCSVELEFANGYTIAWSRKHKIHGNRVVVSLRGEPQPQLEHPDARTTQAAINELLGTDYETYVKTVLLSHGSAASFLNSTPVQRGDLIEASLGLSMLDQCRQVLRLLLRDIDTDVDEVEGQLRELVWTMEHNERRAAEEAVASLEAAKQDHAAAERRINRQLKDLYHNDYTRLGHSHPEFNQDIPDYTQQILWTASKGAQTPDLNLGSSVEIWRLQSQIHIEQENFQQLESSYDRMQEQKHAEPTSWVDGLQKQLSLRLETLDATRPITLRKFFHATETSIIRFLLIAVGSLLRRFENLKDGSKGTSTQEKAINSLHQDIEKSMSRLQCLRHKKQLAIDHAAMVNEQIAQQQVTIKQRDAATYRHLVETGQSSLHSLRSEHDALTTKLRELATNGELFDFWSSALAKRTARNSSSASSPSSTTKATTNFREHILAKSLSELNVLLAQVLTESTETMNNTFSSPSLLDGTLTVHPSLAYGKRSSGERKRVDLVLFFVLLQLSRASTSAHRAHYVLVDEVFDNLDEAGQAAVVRWCGVMSQMMVGWIIIITHSQFLV
ncbi:P-loop containing nucleoside triphosphate hydrolase protein [Apodospora peruviana]|uniref:P-loop containing nucleoside triphosphate hydrolase protein n=1 Tax=Apodospora peruviana TaxID=516989 RepID=A0AAE0IF07_9PEZI|nr:P-loop containing nucleoside triphosphate hydrolase protein [Apodospora peruviana]